MIKFNKIKKNKINLSNLKKILIEKGFVIKKKRNTFFSSDFRSFYLTVICGFGLNGYIMALNAMNKYLEIK